MKIAIFTDTFVPDVNGVAKTLKRYTEYLEKNGHSYIVFAPESTVETKFSNHIHRFSSLPFFLYPECRLALPKFHQIKAEIHQFKPDLIHIATPFNMGLCGLHYAKKWNIPLVGSYHTNFDQYLSYYDLQLLSRFFWKYMHWFHKPFQKIFAPSEETLNELKSKKFQNLSLWKRGVDCLNFSPSHSTPDVKKNYSINDDTYLLSYVGRLAPEKDLKSLLKAAEHPLLAEKNIHWLIVGDGPMKHHLESQAPPNMTIAGYKKGKELSEIYASSDLFVFPSPTETFGNAALEALASGTPVIGANSGGVKNVISHGHTGFLAQPNNPEELAEHIAFLLENTELRKTFEKNAREYAQSQSWDTIFNDLLLECEEIAFPKETKRYA
ncbi:glycosyltransferase family 1 protein [Bacillus gobiensis]|uniref:glycosyltransferase family 4 protein n=1 Tax=Bacillus gobiensis TaxID=1441095 RepID=UPI003D1CBF4D